MLYSFAPDRSARDLVMNSIAPIWDGNETWLILGSVGLLAAFPVAFAIIIPAVYFPILLMLLALIFAGCPSSFAIGTPSTALLGSRLRRGSALAAFAQGVVLGAFIQGFNVQGRQFVGGSFDCFTPFSVFSGVALDVRLCAARLRLAHHQDRGRAAGLGACARPALPDRHAFAASRIVSLWTPYIDVHIAGRWFSFPDIVYLAPVPLITAGLIWYAWQSLNDRSEYAPFLAALGLFVMSYIGIAISLWPMIVPGHFTLREAAASQSTQAFLLIGTLFLLPVILVYTAWSYWVFRGKVRSDIGYH